MWSSDPWDTPMIKINAKQMSGEMVKFLNLKKTNDDILQNKKKIKEWLKFIFLIFVFIFLLVE